MKVSSAYHNRRKYYKKAIKARVIDVGITCVFSYRYMYLISGYHSCIWIPVIGHLRDRRLVTRQIGERRANHDRNFVRYSLKLLSR